ncbi:transposase [Streptomyces sp. NA04227]|uniref:transposase n=1 Tax=Streptomyces sp. NA04227 TaxID=2742136 RepID=UPI0020CA619C|nr:transposase [Streptomyces sp. NA04227]
MTMLRRVMALPDSQFSTPHVKGLDDFAIRRGQTCSTVLTCREIHHVVDVLPTREAGPLATWLTTHPGVEIICRDRAGAYAEGPDSALRTRAGHAADVEARAVRGDPA